MKSYTNSKGKLIGYLWPDGVFRKEVSGSKHLYRNESAWGLDKSILDDLPEGTPIKIKDKEDGTIYITDKETFLTGTLADFGYGEQLLLWKGMFDQRINGELVESDYKKQWKEQVALWDGQ